MRSEPKISDWRKQRRKEYLEQIEHRFYIFCEGKKTEPLYFDGFKRAIEHNPIYKDLVSVEITPCGIDTIRVVEAAKQYVKANNINNGQIWCVFDKDSFPAKDFNGACKLIRKLNKANPELQYKTAWSNECIEIWFVLHFAYYTSNNHRTDYIRFLNDELTKLNAGKYEKNRDDIFELMCGLGNPRLAIRYAKQILKESAGKPPSEIAPGTNVYALVEELGVYLPEKLKERFFK